MAIVILEKMFMFFNSLKTNNFNFKDFLGWGVSVVDKHARNHYTLLHCW